MALVKEDDDDVSAETMLLMTALAPGEFVFDVAAQEPGTLAVDDRAAHQHRFDGAPRAGSPVVARQAPQLTAAG